MSADLTSLLDLLERRLAVVRPSAAPSFVAERLDLTTGEMPYADVVRAIKTVAATLQPADAPIAVISKGDRSLVDLGSHPGWHLPQTREGLYAGYHPKDSTSAIAHLDDLRVSGAAYLIVPRTAFWWFSFYGEFTAHLRQFAQVDVPDGTCRVYRLAGQSAVHTGSLQVVERDVTSLTMSDLHRAIEEQRRRVEHLEHLYADLRARLGDTAPRHGTTPASSDVVPA